MGAGFHGGFGGTKGAEGQKAPVTATKDVRYSKKKTEGYLLNPYHPMGGAKAKFMREVLGYSQADSHLFHKNVAASLVGKNPSKTETSPFGIKHTYRTKVIGKNGDAVILMDIRMPVMDGLEAANAIRSLDREDAKRIPIIAMTANAFAEDVQKSKAAGMNAHLAKPIEPRELYQTLHDFICENGNDHE